MHRSRNRFPTDLAVVVSLLLGLSLCLGVAPAVAEDTLSDRLTDQILQLHRLDMNQQLEKEFERQKQTLGDRETPERAAELRKLLKTRAETYEAIEEVERAEADYDAMLEVRPFSPSVYSDRGYFFMRQSRFQDAVKDFTTGSRLVPTQAAFSYGAARALVRMGNYTGAVAQYTEAMRLSPADSLPVLSRGEALVQLGRYEQARADYDRALALGLRREEDSFFVYFGRGYAGIFLGDYLGAIRDMGLALALRPNMINAIVWRGYAQERSGNRARALEDYEAALRLDPKDDWIRRSVRRLRS